MPITYGFYYRLGRSADEAVIEEIIDMANKASVADQQKQVQENIHSQIKSFCMSMDEILLPDAENIDEAPKLPPPSTAAQCRSGLSFAVGGNDQSAYQPVVPETRPLKQAEVSERLKEIIGYKLDIKSSKVVHEEAGQGIYLDGEADVGAVVAFYPGVIYFPAYYRYIPGYPKVDTQNPYLITRYDGSVINAQPWGLGGETREVWDGLRLAQSKPEVQGVMKGSERFWKVLSTPLEGTQVGMSDVVLERRNPLAFAHFANHPAKGMVPNVMICPYDFPLTEKDMRTYIPNIVFGDTEEVKMKRFGSFWFKLGRSEKAESDVPVLKTLVLVASRTLCDEELFLNYRLSNSKRRPAWYNPVDEEEDRRRWG
ncbi:hypothetical protein CJ030_MR7G011787 [Morella rubra]|uniref:SET domain-containing protein 9 n=1 Tax=Morella rubra TaxID=262757 RepID=A0A6A1V0S7_9ROSI|nr:hypothetical protein CJ030_MR7G011787 [Morella rubra]